MEAASLPLWEQKHTVEAHDAGHKKRFWGPAKGGSGSFNTGTGELLIKGWMINVSSSAGYRVLFHRHVCTTAMGGRIPAKPHLQRQVAGWTWSPCFFTRKSDSANDLAFRWNVGMCAQNRLICAPMRRRAGHPRFPSEGKWDGVQSK